MSTKTLLVLIALSPVLMIFAIDLQFSEITIVDDESRFRVTHPEVELDVFNKMHHIKGNYIFTSGERISGDRLILNFADELQFTRAEDVEVLLQYPAQGTNGNILTKVEIYVALTSEDADSFFIDGGINRSYAKILLTCNRTLNYSYEIFMYGY